ncbi:MAG: ATP-dependent DNA helicase [Undibacterium sp.]|uniref:ATP-dependent DNA helicase n=1 Tax=Undibacterium sp. TaxID=1914977 RepID=UPI0027243ED7|nr:ATP-dependent DNA helicase [Undibacterium sp.]MDO8653162.1 ATP-dependent DNA helicase [Undibacterium sp.]
MSLANYQVGVRALCEFTAKQGDLDLRFTPSPSAQEGIDGHTQVTLRRSAIYQREVRLEGRYAQLHIKGRADGYDPEKQQLEEIKTYRGNLLAMPDNRRQLHWAQARVYAHLLCQKFELATLNVALIYFDVDTQKETALIEIQSAQALASFYNQLCEQFLQWAKQEIDHRQQRDSALKAMRFPYPDFRAGQRQLAEAMYKASNRACCLLAQAPTGIGKTIGSLFPMLKASAEHQLDKIFFLAAKTSGRQLALDAVQILQKQLPNTTLRTLELVAKTKACEFPENACHGESCPLAKGFYDRLPAARIAALQVPILDQERLRSVAIEHQVCPYYLSTEMVKWTDVIVGDYNYYFDLNAMLYALAINNDWKIGVLVDEAHNMVSRARAMYSAELSHRHLKAIRKHAPSSLKKSLDRLHRQWLQIEKMLGSDYVVHATVPEKLSKALETLNADLAIFVAESAATIDSDLQEFFFDVSLFNRLIESFDDHSIFDISTNNGDSLLCIRNIVPASFLKPRFKASHTSALFSATLSPWNYYNDLLGMPDNTAWINVESPFNAEQLSVNVVGQISTRYSDRNQSLAPIVELMATQYKNAPGNYLAFFSSFDYMDQVASLFQERFPSIRVWRQTRGMNEDARNQFLANFTDISEGIGFAVLGGAFGEGIDLPGARLIGAFIATLGLPQINPVNEQVKQRMHQHFGAGYDYTYLYPGIQKVVQAAGRVIRTTSDKGVIYLIDDRFAQPQIQRLLPEWWGLSA